MSEGEKHLNRLQPTRESSAVIIDEGYATRSIEDNFPELRIRTEDVKQIGERFDNVVFRVPIENKSYIFRFCNEKGPADKGESEIRLLPVLQKVLAVPIPNIEYAGLQPTGRYFMGYPMIEGTRLTKGVYDSLPVEQQIEVIDTLGTVFRQVFSFPVDEARKMGVAERDPREWHVRIWNRAQPYLENFLTPEERAKLKQAFDAYLGNVTNFHYTPSLANTDVWYDHVLFDESKKSIAGIIDWTDTFITDPAFAFAPPYRSYGEDFMRELLKRSLDESEMDKVRFIALAAALRRFMDREEMGRPERAQKQLALVKQDLANM